jgi:hypothetical protein
MELIALMLGGGCAAAGCANGGQGLFNEGCGLGGEGASG